MLCARRRVNRGIQRFHLLHNTLPRPTQALEPNALWNPLQCIPAVKATETDPTLF